MNFKRWNVPKTPYPLTRTLIWLTFFFVLWQVIFFLIHYKVSELIDSLVNSSLAAGLLQLSVMLPICLFIALQLVAYAVFISWVRFLTISNAELYQLSNRATYLFGITLWLIASAALLQLNHYYYPESFFAKLLFNNDLIAAWAHVALISVLTLLAALTTSAYINCLWHKRHVLSGSLFLLLALGTLALNTYDHLWALNPISSKDPKKPDIILIGIDSLRPDFIHFYANNAQTATPNIDQFLAEATSFTQAYSPLARTFPAWVSILTGEQPLHHQARNNLALTSATLKNATLAKRLQLAGYETIYATDEKRFSNITKGYGFDQVIGPQMGVNDFLLGGLSDFPLTNLIANLPYARWLFPFNYANRAAAVTYQPETFLQLVKIGLAKRSHKPLFLAIHLCLPHWPFTWAQDNQREPLTMSERYANSVQAVDTQLGQLQQLLKADGLQQNSIVVMLSDHGTTVGLPHDRSIAKETYAGEVQKIKLISAFKLSSALDGNRDLERTYSINTSYGQGNDILSLKQYHSLLAFKRYGAAWYTGLQNVPSSLTDIAPTILDLLHLPRLATNDGMSLRAYLMQPAAELPVAERPIFMETGDSLTEIETDHIYIEKVIKKEIGIYQIDANGLLYMSPQAAASLSKNKQLAVLWQNWLLAHYPAHIQWKFDLAHAAKSAQIEFAPKVIPAYFVLVNTKTGQWTIGLDTPLAKGAPLAELEALFAGFFGPEISFNN